MRKLRTFSALLIALGIIISLTGCKVGGNSKYSVVERLESQQLCVAFRLDDRAGDAVIAAMAELEAEGEVEKLTRKWFGDDSSLLKGEAESISKLDFDVEPRTFIVGYDAGHLPFSGEEGGVLMGFDVEFARAVCTKLGWKIKFVAIDVSTASVELNSGNVDCVWGGLPYSADSKKISQSPPYMKNTIIVAGLSGSGIHSTKGLSDKTLAVSENGCFANILNSHPEISEKSAFILSLPGSVDACLEALDNGVCDAVVADLASIDYYR